MNSRQRRVVRRRKERVAHAIKSLAAGIIDYFREDGLLHRVFSVPANEALLINTYNKGGI